MKKLSLVATVLLSVVFIFSSCNCGVSTPRKLTEDILKAEQAGEYEKAVKLWLDSGNITKLEGEEITELAKKLEESINEKGGFDKYEITGEKINDSAGTATIEATIFFKNGTTEQEKYDFEKIDGVWKSADSK
ncbi:MAG: DUF4878 domain-containing protein [Bacteroidales bacterium]|jgi:hypothetical protein|nr:DUF4878 domain-containing protein [Bacteroidales bacterium]